MKGFTLERDLIVKLVLTVIVLAVVAGIVYMTIIPAAQDQSLRTSITRLCPEWVTKNCDVNKAFDLSNADKKTLAAMCIEDFGDPNAQWADKSDAYVHCKSICVGCPI